MRSRPGERRGSRHAACGAALAMLFLAGCFPALDWRETRPAGSSLRMMFPCRPDHVVRPVNLVGRTSPMAVDSCSAAATTFGLAHFEVAAPADVAPALEAMRTSAAANIGAAATRGEPHRIAGATPNDRMERVRFAGRLADGRAVAMQAVFFVKGLRVYQASVVGTEIGAEASDTFFAAIRFEP